MPDTPFTLSCNSCSAPFADWTRLFDHVIRCTVPVPCKTTVTVSDPENTKKGSSEAKNSITAISKSEKAVTGPFQCECGLSYANGYNLLRHQRQKGCQQQATSSTEPGYKKESETRPGPFFCPYPDCGKVIQYESNYRFHIVFHEEQELKWAVTRSQQSQPTTASAAAATAAGDDMAQGQKDAQDSESTTDADVAQLDIQMEVEV